MYTTCELKTSKIRIKAVKVKYRSVTPPPGRIHKDKRRERRSEVKNRLRKELVEEEKPMLKNGAIIKAVSRQHGVGVPCAGAHEHPEPAKWELDLVPDQKFYLCSEH